MSLTIDQFRFDFLAHERVLAGDTVKERFLVAVFYQGQPLNAFTDVPGSPNQEWFEFFGPLVQDVYNDRGEKVGTKRGADFRASLPRLLYERAESARSGRRMGQVDVAERERVTAVARAALLARSLDEAVQDLTGRAPATRRLR